MMLEAYPQPDENFDTLPPEEQPPQEIQTLQKHTAFMPGALWVPDSKDTVHVTRETPCYDSFTGAWNRSGSRRSIYPGQYYVFKRMHGMLHVTRVLGRPSGMWVNPDDLIGRPAYDWRDSYDELPVAKYYIGNRDCAVIDLEGEYPLQTLQNLQPILIAGFVDGPDGKRYAVPLDARNHVPPIWYAVRAAYVDDVSMMRCQEIPMPKQPDPIAEYPWHVKLVVWIVTSMQRMWKV